MTLQITKDTLNKALESLELDIKVHTDYSGRGMYDRTCLGVEFDNANDPSLLIFGLAVQIAKEKEDPGTEIDEYMIWDSLLELYQGRPKMDNMGRNGVIYWPHIEIIEGE